LVFIKYNNLSQQLPPALLASLQTVKGFDENAFKEAHQSGKQITSIRFNTNKLLQSSETSPFEGDLEGAVPWCSVGFYLPERPSFTSDPLFHAGAYYVQEASSMFLEEAIKQTCDLSQPLRVLDLCAAPGGKSTLVQSIISANSLLVSNEVIKTRVNILSENITKWGAENVVVTNNDPKDFQRLPDFFDLVIVDAPCSGSGLFRKDPEAIEEWSLNNVSLCSQRQQRILSDILPALKPGGILIYATCSYSEAEDEEICDWLLSGIPHTVSGIQLKIIDTWNIIETISAQHNAYGYRFYPDKLKGEGFFIAAFKKDDVAAHVKNTKPAIHLKKKLQMSSKTELEIIKPYFKNTDLLSFFNWQDEIIAVPSFLINDLLLLQSSLYIKKAAVKVGTVIRNELVPDHEFALSNLTADSIASINVDRETALQYLRRQDISIDTSLKGWALIKFQSIALGWVKILPHRINNYYPKSWRILNK
jgi:16S rRNA C967 or C1407 C5-methylase (RsmB/RsmF family)/NOL1/NOP2/fmu family ribosome biogenesis protein